MQVKSSRPYLARRTIFVHVSIILVLDFVPHTDDLGSLYSLCFLPLSCAHFS